MKPYYEDDLVTLYHGDCLEVMRTLPDDSLDAVVTDPPYGLEFMGKGWDAPWREADINADAGFNGGGIAQTKNLPSFTGSTNPKCLHCKGTRRGRRDGTAKVSVCLCLDGGRFPNVRAVEMRAFGEWCETWAAECLRVLKPGGHMLAFGGTRTWHRLACAVEDAGFEVRDSIAWMYGSGFPKSLDVSKAIDKAAGVEREVVGSKETRDLGRHGRIKGDMLVGTYEGGVRLDITAPATPDAERWQGWGTALKPGHEPCLVAQKPAPLHGILDAIGSHVARLESECRSLANGAARGSTPTRAASSGASPASAPESAAIRHGGVAAKTTRTGVVAGSSAATDMSASESMGGTCWSTVTSWRECLVELYELTSTYTTSTTIGLTTDLQTLSSSISSLTVTSTPDNPTPQLTEWSTASAVDSLFAATVLSLRATLALSARGPATASTLTSPRAAAGASAFEPVVVARKPLIGTVAANVLAHGTGALNVDGCRVEGEPWKAHTATGPGSVKFFTEGDTPEVEKSPHAAGRWPANVILDESQAEALDEQSGILTSGLMRAGTKPKGERETYGQDAASGYETAQDTPGDSGGASRFFYVANHEPYELVDGCPDCEWETHHEPDQPFVPFDQMGERFKYVAKADASERVRINGVAHSTVKPLALMRWLVRLVTPPGGTILEPFAGSGTTVEACLLEGFKCVAIEREADYLPLIKQRINRRRDPVEAVRAAGEDGGLFDLIGEVS